ncbi:MAG: hypothetical protein P4L03_06210 [Terracidiphilus sp.]|nr:hypothetical protein [Terracidiphilus sp.]
MPSFALISARDIFLYAIPLVLVLFASIFRLDEFFCSQRNHQTNRKKAQIRQYRRRSGLGTDPDGRSWNA